MTTIDRLGMAIIAILLIADMLSGHAQPASSAFAGCGESFVTPCHIVIDKRP
jgi:hypothetical protein